MAAEARKFGLVLSNETIKQADEAGDEIDKIGLSMKVAGANLTAGFLPALQELRKIVTSQEFQQGIKDLGTNIGIAVKWMADNSDTVRNFAYALSGMAIGGRLAGGFGALAGGLVGLGTATVTAGRGIKEVNIEISMLERELATFERMQAGEVVGRAIIRDPETLQSNIEEVRGRLIALRAERDKLAAPAPTQITIRPVVPIDPQALEIRAD